ncbi:MAG: gliding motility-associated C-terminal domain-containing protein, partial [Bacteroidetes bacterium]|nr:gliding motility-associated C-terminal domain-containing protein [Bacteroidota bacterium]
TYIDPVTLLPVTINYSFTINTGTLAPLGSMIFELDNTYDITIPGAHTFTATTMSPDDIDPSNDLFPDPSVYFNEMGTANVNTLNACFQTPITLTISGSSWAVQWESSPDGITWANETDPGNNTAEYTTIPNGDTHYRALLCGIPTNELFVTVVPLPTIVMDWKDIDCFGANNGAAWFKVSNISPAYTFEWQHNNNTTDDSLFNLSAGIYEVKITDVYGCEYDEQVEVIEPLLLELTHLFLSPTCIGGSNGVITLDAIGGTTPYDFYFSNNLVLITPAAVSGLSAGPYEVKVIDASGCEVTETIIIPEPTGMELILDIDNATCIGRIDGKITALTSGGLSPYSYTWGPLALINNPVVQNLSPGTYTVTVTDDNGCEISATGIVEENHIALTFSTTPADCKTNSTGTAEVFISGGSGVYDILWDNNKTTGFIDNLSSGMYAVKVIDSNACENTDSVNVERIMVVDQADFTYKIVGPRIEFTDQSIDAAFWAWDFGNGQTSEWHSPTVSYSKPGVYSILLTTLDSNGCKSTKTAELQVEEIFIPNVFSPNGDGQNETFYIVHPNFTEFTIEIFNRWGAIVWETTAPEIRWDGRTKSGLPVPEGTYFYKFKASGNGTTYDASGNIQLFR